MEISNPEIELIKDPKSHERCSFCDSVVNNPLRYGDMYKYKDIICHYFCVLMSSQLQQNGEDNEGFFGFLIDDLKKELERVKTVKCCFCKRPGATAKCNFKSGRKKCQSTFHFTCGITHGTLHYFFGKFQSLCVSHRRSQKIPEEFIKDSATQCWICHDLIQDVSSDFSSLWAPCCKKSYFHKDCVQRHAYVSGDYHFKCPLCNNKDGFKRAMLHCGIFLPVRDAEWEREPNAYSDLYHEHNQCDVEVCICPHSIQDSQKRQYNSGAWDIVRCFTCGSEGTHRPCAGLPLKGDITWSCGSCRQIINKDKETSGEGSQDAEKEKVIEPDTCCADVCSCNKGREYRVDKGMYRAVYCSDCEYSWIHTRCRNAAYGEVARGEWICTGCQMSDDEDSNSPGTSDEVAKARDPFAVEELTKKQVLSPCYVLLDRLFTRGSYQKFSHLLSRRAYNRVLKTRRKTVHAQGFVFTGQTCVKRNEANKTVDEMDVETVDHGREDVEALETNSGDLKDVEALETNSGDLKDVEALETNSGDLKDVEALETNSGDLKDVEALATNSGDLKDVEALATNSGDLKDVEALETNSGDLKDVKTLESGSGVMEGGEPMESASSNSVQEIDEKAIDSADVGLKRLDLTEEVCSSTVERVGMKLFHTNADSEVTVMDSNDQCSKEEMARQFTVVAEMYEKKVVKEVEEHIKREDGEERSGMREISMEGIFKNANKSVGETIFASIKNVINNIPRVISPSYVETVRVERRDERKVRKESCVTEMSDMLNEEKSEMGDVDEKISSVQIENFDLSDSGISDSKEGSDISNSEIFDSLHIKLKKEETDTVKTNSESKRWKNSTPLKISPGMDDYNCTRDRKNHRSEREHRNDESLSRCPALSVSATSTAQILRESLNSGEDLESNFSPEKFSNDNVNTDGGSENGLNSVEKLQEVKKTDISTHVENVTNTSFESVNTCSDSRKGLEEVLTDNLNIVRIRKTKCLKQGDEKGRNQSEPLLLKHGIKPFTGKPLRRRKRDSIRRHKYKMNRSVPQATDSKERKRSLGVPASDSLRKAFREKRLNEHKLEPKRNSLCCKRKCAVFEENSKAKKTRTSFNTKNNRERLNDTVTNSSVESKWKSALIESITNGLGTQDSNCGVAMKESNALEMNGRSITRDARTNRRVLRRSRLVVQYEAEEISFKNSPHKAVEHGKERDTRECKLNGSKNENEPDGKSENMSSKVNEHGGSKSVGKSIIEVFNHLLNSTVENSIDKPTANSENESKELFANIMNKIKENAECGAMGGKLVEERTPDEKKSRHTGCNMQAVSYSTKKIYEYFNCSASTAAVSERKTSAFKMNWKTVATSTPEKIKIERTSRKRSISESWTESVSQSDQHLRKRKRLMSTSHGEETQLVPKRERKFTPVKAHSLMKHKLKSKGDTTSRKIYEYFSTASPSPVGSDLRKSICREFYNGHSNSGCSHSNSGCSHSNSGCKVYNPDAHHEGYNQRRETERNSEHLHKAITDERLRDVSDTQSKQNIRLGVHARTTRRKNRNRHTKLNTTRSHDSKTNFNITDSENKQEVFSPGDETVSNRDENRESVCIDYNQCKEGTNISASEKICIDNTKISKEKFAASDSRPVRQGRFTVTNSDVENKQVRVLGRRHTMTDENDSPNKPVHETTSRSRRASTRMSSVRRDLSHRF